MEKVIVGYFWWPFIFYFAGSKTHEWARGTTIIPKWMSRLLFLPYNKTGEVPIYLVFNKTIMQISTLIVLVLFLFNRFDESVANAYVVMIAVVLIVFIAGFAYCRR